MVKYNYTENDGAGLHATACNLELVNVTFLNNIAEDDGGAIYLRDDFSSFENVIISDNTAEDKGGGIFCYNASPDLINVKISNNNSFDKGGGIYLDDESQPVFNSENRCNIFLNNSVYTSSSNDIYSQIAVDVIVDTFSVLNPTMYHASPIENFNFDILNSKLDQVEGTVYVSPEGNNGNCGSSIDEPVKTIQFALSIINSPAGEHGTIFLLNGTYSPTSNGETFPLCPVSYISFTGENESAVILDAEGNSQVLCLDNVNNIDISNLTIANGYVEGNNADGGGIFCVNSDLFISHVTLTNNNAEYHGGGIYSTSSDLILEGVTIAGNSCSISGGGLSAQFSDIRMENVIIDNNISTENGGGIFFNYSSSALYDVAIRNNSSEHGGAIYSIGYSFTDLVNVTISDNTAELDGGGIYLECPSSMNLVNCIMWNDDPYEIWLSELLSEQYFNVTNSDIEGGNEGIIIYWGGIVNWLEGNIDEDPLFVDAEMGDYRLSENSACIDAGTAYFEFEGEVLIDLSENEYYGIAPDMGAFEYGMVEMDEGVIENEKLKIDEIAKSIRC